MKTLKKLFSLINLFITTLFITSFLTYSYFNSNKFLSHEILNSNMHSFLSSSLLIEHHDSHDTHTDTRDDGIDHVHKHHHSENEEEHAHKHINLISFLEVVISKSINIEFRPIETKSAVHFNYSLKSYDSFVLEILKPPIRS